MARAFPANRVLSFPLTVLRRCTVARAGPLLAYLIESLGLKRKTVKNLLKFGAVSVNGATVRQFDRALAIGDEVLVSNAQTAAAAGRLEHARIQVVYEDGAIVVLDKPAGLLTVAACRRVPGASSRTLGLRTRRFTRSGRRA